MNERFGLLKFGTLIDNHGYAEERGGIRAFGELDGLLEFRFGIFDVTHTIVCNSQIVISVKGIGSKCDCGLEV